MTATPIPGYTLATWVGGPRCGETVQLPSVILGSSPLPWQVPLMTEEPEPGESPKPTERYLRVVPRRFNGRWVLPWYEGEVSGA